MFPIRKSELRPTLSRRTLLSNTAIVAAATSLSGCCNHHTTSILKPVGLPPVGKTDQGLLIDAHCHIFNGSDLPVKEFIARVVLAEPGIPQELKNVAGELVRLLALPAPCGDQELGFLKQLSDKSGMADAILEAARDHRYKATRKDVLRALTQMNAPTSEPQTVSVKAVRIPLALTSTPARRSLAAVMQTDATENEYKWHIKQSFEPNDYKGFKATQDATLAAMPSIRASIAESDPPCTKPIPSFSVPGLVGYLAENDQYRITEVQDYLTTFTGNAPQAERNVDLMVAHLVDYDWWLSQGRPNETPLQKQIDVMSEISIYTKGQVHAFAPFDPLREVAFRAQKHYPVWSSLQFIKDAICNKGCIGVKLYPPMGFAASGNASQNPDIYKFGNFLPWMRDGSLLDFHDTKPPAPLGVRLDQVLEEFFTWCEKYDVPVMCHSAATNGQNDTLMELATAKHWAPVIQSHPKLRINFGHLGNFSKIPPCGNIIPYPAEDLIKILAQGKNVYGDAGYNSEILGTKLEPVEVRYNIAYNDRTLPKDLLPTRMMYGTDWNLLMHIGNVENYQTRFQALAAQLPEAPKIIGKHSVQDRFLGWNAVDYLGLRKNDQTRKRLEAFYAANGLTLSPTQMPEWMRKVDSEA